MVKFSEQEIQTRRELVKPIVEAAYSLKGVILSEETIESHAKHWERVFVQVGTPQLRELYELGVQHNCQTPEQFLMYWEMKIQAEFSEAEHKRQMEKYEQAERASKTPEAIRGREKMAREWGFA